MVYEFEGKTEKDAIEKAMQELGIERDSFDVEILEAQRGGLFKKSYVKIRLHTGDYPGGEPGQDVRSESSAHAGGRGAGGGRHSGREAAGGNRHSVGEAEGGAENTSVEGGGDSPKEGPAPVDDGEFEANVAGFLSSIISKLGIAGNVTVSSRSRRKLVLNIETEDSPAVIGKRGRNIDALQILVSIYASKFVSNIKVVVDCGNYRQSHDESLVRLAHSVAAKVRATRQSILLDPMNPYDRRIIHTTAGDSPDIDTASEGEGLFKQIRVSYKGR